MQSETSKCLVGNEVIVWCDSKYLRQGAEQTWRYIEDEAEEEEQESLIWHSERKWKRISDVWAKLLLHFGEKVTLISLL